MTNQQHLIPPPLALLRQWVDLLPQGSTKAFTAAAQWGADQELEACLKAFDAAWDDPDNSTVEELQRAVRAARRPKPPSLKEQALEMLDCVPTHDCDGRWYGLDLSLIRCALEQLDD